MNVIRTGLITVFALFLLAPSAHADAAKDARTEASKKLVLDFWRVVIDARDLDQVEQFLDPNLIQHNPRLGNGVQAFREFAAAYWRGQPKLPVEPTLTTKFDVVLANDDLVLLMRRIPTPDPSDPSKTYDRFGFDLYRVANGKIVEHWDEVRK